MGISLSCSPDNAFENCGRIVTIAVNDDKPQPDCTYWVYFSFSAGTKDVAHPALMPRYLVDPGASCTFLIKGDGPGVVTIRAEKSCPFPQSDTRSEDIVAVETVLCDFEILECQWKSAAGTGAGFAAGGVALIVAGGIKVTGSAGMSGGPVGVGVGIGVGVFAGLITYWATKPNCCPEVATIYEQGLRNSFTQVDDGS